MFPIRSLLVCGLALVAALPGLAQQAPRSLNVQVADLEQDVRMLQRELGAMRVEMEALVRENRNLRQKLEETSAQNTHQYVTLQQLNSSLSEVQKRFADTTARNRTEITNLVSSEIEALADQTQRAINALARSVEGRPRMEQVVTFSDNYPRSGTSYRVRRGDTLSRIAQQHNSRIDWIRNANRLPGDTIREGQELFIPQQSN